MKHKRIMSKKTINEIRSTRCEICGQRTNIEPHHINTRGSGGGDIRENLIQLCTQCHINTHSGQYPTKDDCLNKVKVLHMMKCMLLIGEPWGMRYKI